MFGTYLSNPTKGHEHMTIGLEQYRDPNQLTWLNLMALPFVGESENYSAWHDEQKVVLAGNKK